MAEMREEAWQDDEIPRSMIANRKSLLGLLPSVALFFLSYASFTRNNIWENYTPLGYVWGATGFALAIASVIGFRMVDVRRKSELTSLLIFGWACLNALLGVAFFFGSDLPHNAWTGFGYAVITMALMHMGAAFIVWDTLTGIFGAYAKAIAVAMGSAAIVASMVISMLLSESAIFFWFF